MRVRSFGKHIYVCVCVGGGGGYFCAVWVGPSYDNEKHGSLYIALLKHASPTWCSHNSATGGCLKSTKSNMLFSLVPRFEEEEEKGLGSAPPLRPGTEATCSYTPTLQRNS